MIIWKEEKRMFLLVAWGNIDSFAKYFRKIDMKSSNLLANFLKSSWLLGLSKTRVFNNLLCIYPCLFQDTYRPFLQVCLFVTHHRFVRRCLWSIANSFISYASRQIWWITSSNCNYDASYFCNFNHKSQLIVHKLTKWAAAAIAVTLKSHEYYTD